MSRIFVSYRRTDVPDMVGRIYDNLTRSFRRHEVFKDVDSIHYGTDFRTVIRDALERCPIVLVAIGPDWLNTRNEQGQPRLENPDDFIRLELETAFEREATIIPLLIGGAEIPPPQALPETLRRLAFLHALPIRRDPDFSGDFNRLKREIARLRSPSWRLSRAIERLNRTSNWRRPELFLGAAAIGIVTLMVLSFWAGTQMPATGMNPPAPTKAQLEQAKIAEIPDDRQKATAAATAIITSLAEKNYQRLWDEQTSKWLKERMDNNRESFLANIALIRAPTGPLKSSKVIDVGFTTTDPNSGFKGKIYTVNFSTSYETGNFYERIVVIEEDGRFLMSGFNGAPAP
jgi:TIR domain/Protein of unknown function (DUF4019)